MQENITNQPHAHEIQKLIFLLEANTYRGFRFLNFVPERLHLKHFKVETTFEEQFGNTLNLTSLVLKQSLEN